MTPKSHPLFETRLARDSEDHRAALALRYRVFVAEMGGTGAGVDHEAGLEQDRFDAHAAQLLLIDHARAAGDQVVGVYRLIDRAAADRAGGFYTAAEYDLAPLLAAGRPLLELGRSCLHPDYRGGSGMYHLWQALAAYVAEHGIELLFGVASFPGCDIARHAAPLTMLQAHYLAPEGLRPRSRAYQRMDLMPLDQIDRVTAMRQTPALIKAYLRLGGLVGDGAYVDHAFNTTDICLVLDTAALRRRQKAIYAGADA